MVTLYYKQYGFRVFEDWTIETHILSTLGKGKNLNVSSELAVTAARALYCNGQIPKFNIVYVRNDNTEEVIPMADDAGIDYWPKGFCDKEDKWFEMLFGE